MYCLFCVLLIPGHGGNWFCVRTGTSVVSSSYLTCKAHSAVGPLHSRQRRKTKLFTVHKSWFLLTNSAFIATSKSNIYHHRRNSPRLKKTLFLGFTLLRMTSAVTGVPLLEKLPLTSSSLSHSSSQRGEHSTRQVTKVSVAFFSAPRYNGRRLINWGFAAEKEEIVVC